MKRYLQGPFWAGLIVGGGFIASLVSDSFGAWAGGLILCIMGILTFCILDFISDREDKNND